MQLCHIYFSLIINFLHFTTIKTAHNKYTNPELNSISAEVKNDADDNIWNDYDDSNDVWFYPTIEYYDLDDGQDSGQDNEQDYAQDYVQDLLQDFGQFFGQDFGHFFYHNKYQDPRLDPTYEYEIKSDKIIHPGDQYDYGPSYIKNELQIEDDNSSYFEHMKNNTS